MSRVRLWLVLGVSALLLAACTGPEQPTRSVPAAQAAMAIPTNPAVPSATAPAQVSPAGQVQSGSPRSSPVAAGQFLYGFNVFARGDADGAAFNRQTFQLVTAAGFTAAHIQVSWKQFEPNRGQWDPLPLDRITQDAQQAHVQVLISLVDFPDWARDPKNAQLLADWTDFQTYARFIADRYKGKVAGWEIGNEENMAYTVGGTVRVTDYAKLLEAGYAGIKAADPRAPVLFGGLTPTGVNDPKIAIDDVQYLKQFYALENGRYAKFFDILGMHANATHNPPDTMWPSKPGPGPGWFNDGSFYFRRVEQLHQVMVDHNDQRPAWITEFGWTTANQAPGYEYGKDVTAQEQADYLVGAYRLARASWPWCQAMFVWNLNYSVVSPPSDEKTPWAVLNSDWSPRPSYTALQQMPKQ